MPAGPEARKGEIVTHSEEAVLLAGIPGKNLGLYRRIRFDVHDPVAFIEIPGGGSTLILRDIELARARESARADVCVSPPEFTPEGGLSADRETATAQAAAECLRRAGVRSCVTDRALPMIFAHYAEVAGIAVRCDPEMGLLERRMKDEEEIEHLRTAQRATESAIERACTTIARAKADAEGVLIHEGEPLTSERVRAMIDAHLIAAGYDNSAGSIVASGVPGHDCHFQGAGVIRTGEPVIVDVFPMNKVTRYNGDCTRCVVHGAVPPAVERMHAAIVEAKRAAIAACVLGGTGAAVHEATSAVIRRHGFGMGVHQEGEVGAKMVHGTGHGIGLEVHEPPLLDAGVGPLVQGDCLTVEPGLYDPAVGGLRIEDMVVVTEGAPLNLNTLHEGLDWTG